MLIAVVSSLLAVRLALWRFHSEKWWERKAELYSRLLEALFEILDYNGKWLEDYQMGDQEVHLTPEQIAKKNAKNEALLDRQQKAKTEVDKIAIIGAFIVSDAVADDLLSFQKAEREAWGEIRENDVYSGVEQVCAGAQQCIRAVREDAKEDLGLKRTLPPLVADLFTSGALRLAMRTVEKAATRVLTR